MVAKTLSRTGLSERVAIGISFRWSWRIGYSRRSLRRQIERSSTVSVPHRNGRAVLDEPLAGVYGLSPVGTIHELPRFSNQASLFSPSWSHLTSEKASPEFLLGFADHRR